MTNVIEIAKQFPEISLTVKARDLIEVVDYCVGKTRAELEQQITDINAETYPTVTKTAMILNVSKVTLWRWARKEYLVPIDIGGCLRYRMSDINKILKKA